MTPLPRIDIVTLSYKHAAWIEPCLTSLVASGYPADRLTLILVDNASGDGSEAAYHAVREKLRSEHPLLPIHVVQTGKNLGFSGGNNLGWKMGTAPYVLFLNLDTTAQPGCLNAMVEALEACPTAGIAGAKLYFPGTKKLQHAGGMIYLNGMTDHVDNSREDEGQVNETREVAFVTGACLMIRRKLLTALEGFDEDFFPAYYEDADLCLRARRISYSTLFVPAAVLEHHESAGLGGRRDPRVLELLYRGRARLVAKNWTPADFFERWLPTERWWFGIVESKESRPLQWRSYWQAMMWMLSRTGQLLFHWGPLPPPAGSPLPQHIRHAGHLGPGGVA